MFRHVDALQALDTSQPLERKLAAIHEALYAQVDSVDRISVAERHALRGRDMIDAIARRGVVVERRSVRMAAAAGAH